VTTWDDLRGRSLARQFPQGDPSSADLVAATGPIQSQTARSPFLGLAARSADATHASITAAYEAGALVRGSVVRGTVHTATPEHQAVLDAITRIGQRRLWERTVPLGRHTMEEVWAGIETFAHEEWRTPAELHEHLTGWLRDKGEATDRLDDQGGRYFAFGHGGLVRRPLKGGWDGQTAPGYRAREAVTGVPLPEPDAAVDAAVRLHLRCHGPASRHDVAWWSGLGLRVVDEGLARVDAAVGLSWTTGPDGRDYAELPDAPTPTDLPGVRLLPEFDALLCGYDPQARDRFVTPEHHRALWNSANGLVLPALFVDGRVTGWWRAAGSARKRPLEVAWFPGTRRPRKDELAEAVVRVEAGLGITITEVTMDRASA